jgi:biopolymer transport protein ExbD
MAGPFYWLGLLSVVALILSCASNGYAKQDRLKLDAKAFCEVHAREKWGDVSPDLSVTEFETLVRSRQRSAIETSEFVTLLDELDQIRFYRDLYPTAKKKISLLIGEPWHCPAYEAFYRLKVEKAGGDAKLEPQGDLQADIVISSEGGYLLQGVPCDLNSEKCIGRLKQLVQYRKDAPVVIRLDDGSSDSHLQTLFKALASLKVNKVTVLEDN